MAETDSIVIPPQVKDLTGHVIGRWTVLKYLGTDKHGHARWDCQCLCGTRRAVLSSSLVRRISLSCGCRNREVATALSTTHGKSETPEHQIWCHMRSRCHIPTDTGYHNYGGRGITVCDEWRESFAAFFEDMGERPSSEHSIDRIDNDGNYEPGNCRWATTKEQARNTRRSRMLTLNGKTMCVTDWAKEIGLTPSALLYRLRLGWSVERVLTEPRRHRHLPL